MAVPERHTSGHNTSTGTQQPLPVWKRKEIQEVLPRLNLKAAGSRFLDVERSGHHLAQHIMENATATEVGHFISRVDPATHGELALAPVGLSGYHR